MKFGILISLINDFISFQVLLVKLMIESLTVANRLMSSRINVGSFELEILDYLLNYKLYVMIFFILVRYLYIFRKSLIILVSIIRTRKFKDHFYPITKRFLEELL